jgi:hypothetical protein
MGKASKTQKSLKLLCSSKNGVIGLNKKILRLKELVGQ